MKKEKSLSPTLKRKDYDKGNLCIEEGKGFFFYSFLSNQKEYIDITIKSVFFLFVFLYISRKCF